jgi:putative ABC transport system permease protein
MPSALDRKLLRDLKSLRGQIITVALVVATGIACYVMMQGTWISLHRSRDRYYQRYRFADVTVHLKRAPENVAERLREIPGVARVYTRVVSPLLLPLPDMPEPASGNLVSIPDGARPDLNDILLHEGRLPEGSDEVVLLQVFADAHGLKSGDTLPAVINGARRELRIVGIGNSPEYVVVPRPPGSFIPDPKRFAALWMRRSAMAPAYQMDGAFNDVCLALRPGTDSRAVEEQLDSVIASYGGLGAISPEKHFSNFDLNRSIEMVKNQATIVPTLLLGVAAFLLSVVLSRLVGQQRPEIASLKAVGYTDRQIAVHYLKLVSVVVLPGAALGVGFGVWLGRLGMGVWHTFFKLPELTFELEPQHAIYAVLISLLAAVISALGTARHVARLAPAEAMRPPPPARYRSSLLDRLLDRPRKLSLLGPTSRMIVREIERHPLRTLFSALGIAMAVATTMAGLNPKDTMPDMAEVTIPRIMPEDLGVAFIDPRSQRAVRELAHVPGVLHAEGIRIVPVRFRAGHRFRDSVLWGFPHGAQLRRVYDRFSREVPLPEHGVLLTDVLAEFLHVRPGDQLEVEIREGRRRTVWLPVAALLDESIGLQGYLPLDVLHRLLAEEDNVSMALLRIDPNAQDLVQQRLREMPAVASITRPANLGSLLLEQTGALMEGMAFMMTLFAAIIGVGVVYNNARVALSVRSRDLASLRVLGFTRAEIARILLGELAVQVLLGIPLGLWLGIRLTEAMANPDPEAFRSPVSISAHVYSSSAMLAIVSFLISAWLVRRRLNHLDLIGVLKTRE